MVVALLGEDFILTLLQQLVPEQDLISCTMVSKRFRIHFLPALFYRLSFSRSHDYSYLEIYTSDEYRDFIQRHAHLIRIIHIRNCSEPDRLLAVFSSPSTGPTVGGDHSLIRLENLNICLKYELTKDVFPVLDLVERNPGLKTFKLEGIPIKRKGIAPRLLQVLREHPSLREVEFLSADNKISKHLYLAILQSLPRGLEKLELKWKIRPQDDKEFEYRDADVVLPGWWETITASTGETEKGKVPVPRRLLNLEKVIFPEELEGYETDVWIPFLEHCCPDLKELGPPPFRIQGGAVEASGTIESTATLLEQSLGRMAFPRLSTLVLHGHESDGISAALIRGCSGNTDAKKGAEERNAEDAHKNTLSRITFEWGSTMGPQVLQAMISRSSSISLRTSLTRIDIESSVYIRSMDIQTLLCECTNLKIFSVEDFAESQQETVLEIKDMATRGEWACVGLESLTLSLGYDYGPGNLPSSSSAAVASVTLEATQDDDHDFLTARKRIIQGAYRQLSRLTELRHLSFGHVLLWDNSSKFPMMSSSLSSTTTTAAPSLDFDFTVGSGLDQLKTLTKLLNLDIKALRHRVGMMEMKWMDEHWLMLESCAGLDFFEGEELSEWEDEDEDEELQEEEGEAEGAEEELIEGEDEEAQEDEEQEEEDEDHEPPRRPHIQWMLNRRPHFEAW